MIDFFLPYLPLELPHIRRLFDLRLRDEADALRHRHRCLLQWGAPVLDFLVSKVRYAHCRVNQVNGCKTASKCCRDSALTSPDQR